MIYPDASMLIAANVSEVMSDEARVLLAEADALSAGEWTTTEIASGLAIEERTRQPGRDDRLRSCRDQDVDRRQLHPPPVAAGDCRTAFSLIDRSTLYLRGRDVLHLAIAAGHDATLWTPNRRMAAAGQAPSLDVRPLD